jgi:hypothetical protein
VIFINIIFFLRNARDKAIVHKNSTFQNSVRVGLGGISKLSNGT